MKTIYKILAMIFLMQTVLLSQVEIISTKNTQTGECKGGVDLGLVTSGFSISNNCDKQT